MNAPVSAALLAAHAINSAPLPTLQPTVSSSMQLLMTAYRFKDLHLDLYGYANESDGCSVEAVALTGTTVDISGLLTMAQRSVMAWAVDKAGVLTRAASRAERAAWDRAAMA